MDMKKRYYIVVSLALIAVSSPFLYAFLRSNTEWIFGGFLLNPIDGHSYLAKMQQGFNGSWKFTLPYTAESGQGAYLFLFYICLGQFARLFNLSLISVFHAARLIGSSFLLYAIWKLVRELYTDESPRFFAFIIIIFGSGLGWLAVLANKITSDFWVAEAYPFLSMYANPHFPIGLGLMISMLIPGKRDFLKSVIIGVPLAIIQPFSIVILIVVFLIRFIVEIFETKGLELEIITQSRYLIILIGLGLTGGIILIYQYWSILSDPVLSIWNFQNQTPPPDPVDFLISFLPVILMGFFGAKEAWKTELGKTLIIWSVVSILLLFVPWNLPRRFLTGLFIPLGGLSIIGLKKMTKIRKYSFQARVIIFLILILPTNLVVLISGIQAAKNYDQNIYYSANLGKCFQWIDINIDVDELIMADEYIGLLIPSVTGNRVIYGHPFETANAEIELNFINDFYDRKLINFEDIGILTARNIDLILVQKDNNPLFGIQNTDKIRIVYRNPDYVLYELFMQ